MDPVKTETLAPSVRERAEALMRDPELHRLLTTELTTLFMGRGRTNEQRFIRLREITDEAAARVAPYTPCRKGCSHCCYQATTISAYEALRIGERSGRTPRQLRVEHRNRKAMEDRYMGVPCPFLDQQHGECTVYDERPIACREHNSLEDTAQPCDIKNAPGGKLTKLGMGNILTASVALQKDIPVFADIREFFP